MRHEQQPSPDTPAGVKNVYLQPGEYFWGNETTRIKTLLGSCVAICVWHPVRKIGGMSHCLLPTRRQGGLGGGGGQSRAQDDFSGRYLDETFDIFFAEMNRHATQRKDYVVKVFGGGNMFELPDKTGLKVGGPKGIVPAANSEASVLTIGGPKGIVPATNPEASMLTIGEKNLTILRSIIKREGMRIAAEHVGGKGHRNVIFELWNGDCWVRHTELP